MLVRGIFVCVLVHGIISHRQKGGRVNAFCILLYLIIDFSFFVYLCFNFVYFRFISVCSCLFSFIFVLIVYFHFISVYFCLLPFISVVKPDSLQGKNFGLTIFS